MQPLVERMDYLELLFYWGYGGGFAILVLLILIAPVALRDKIYSRGLSTEGPYIQLAGPLRRALFHQPGPDICPPAGGADHPFLN